MVWKCLHVQDTSALGRIPDGELWIRELSLLVWHHALLHPDSVKNILKDLEKEWLIVQHAMNVWKWPQNLMIQ